MAASACPSSTSSSSNPRLGPSAMPELCKTAATRAAASIDRASVGAPLPPDALLARSFSSTGIQGRPGMASNNVSCSGSMKPNDCGTVNAGS